VADIPAFSQFFLFFFYPIAVIEDTPLTLFVVCSCQLAAVNVVPRSRFETVLRFKTKPAKTSRPFQSKQAVRVYVITSTSGVTRVVIHGKNGLNRLLFFMKNAGMAEQAWDYDYCNFKFLWFFMLLWISLYLCIIARSRWLFRQSCSICGRHNRPCCYLRCSAWMRIIFFTHQRRKQILQSLTVDNNQKLPCFHCCVTLRRFRCRHIWQHKANKVIRLYQRFSTWSRRTTSGPQETSSQKESVSISQRCSWIAWE